MFSRPLSCPHCHVEIVLSRLRHQGMLASHRVCPGCGEAFTVDARTKRRQAAFILVALTALAFTTLLYFRGTGWLPAALVAYVVLAGLIAWGNSQVRLVPREHPGSEP